MPMNHAAKKSSSARKNRRRHPLTRRGFFEQLEDRRVMATFYVDDALAVTLDRDSSTTLTNGDRVTFSDAAHGVVTNLTFNQAPIGGDVGTAFSTLSQALASPLVTNGDTIRVGSGNYVHTGTMTIGKSVTILGAGIGSTSLRRSGSPVGASDLAFNITAATNGVSIQSANLGWQTPSATDYLGDVVKISGANASLRKIQVADNYRSAALMSGANGFQVTESKFSGKFGHGVIRDDAAVNLAGSNFLISKNEFTEDHFNWGPVAFTGTGTIGGTISYNYFANGVQAGSFVAGGVIHTVNIATPNLAVGGVQVIHNTFDWQDSLTLNSLGETPQITGVFVNPANTYTQPILIQDNIFNGLQNSASPQASPLWQAAAAPIPGNGGSVQFDGINDFAQFQSGLFDIDDRGTFSVWVKLDTVAKRNQIFEGPPTNGFEFQVRDTGDVFFYTNQAQGNNALTWSSTTIPINVWRNLQFTWDAAADQTHIYIDGVEVAYRPGFTSAKPNWTAFVNTMNQVMNLGRDPGDSTRYFDGSMDDVGFFNVALTPAQLTSIRTGGVAAMAASANLLAHWDLDSPLGTFTEFDNKNNIPLQFSVDGVPPLETLPVAFQTADKAPLPGNVGALDFSGSNSFAQFQSALFDVGAKGTLSFWTKMDNVAKRNQFFEIQDNVGMEFQYRDISSGQVFSRPSAASGDFVIRSGPDGATLANSWHNIQYTWDFSASNATGKMRIYIDGVESSYLAGFTPNDLNWPAVVSTVNQLVSMGIDFSDQSRDFDGKMDDVGWFKDVLTLAERNAIRAAGVSTLAGDARLVAHWDLDSAPGSVYEFDNQNGIVLRLQGINSVGSAGYAVQSPNTLVTVNRNLFWNVDQAATTADMNSVNADPLFVGVGPPSSYYALQPASPALGTATDLTNIGAWQLADSVDWGDAPNTFGTLAASNGANHVTIGPLLGAMRDVETDGVPTAAANGDDVAGVDDEDGVTLSPMAPGGQALLTITVANGPGFVDGWIDYDGNGSFQPAERIVTGAYATGSHGIILNIPANAVQGTRYARFRVNSAANMGPTGSALTGEVEDYSFTITSPAIVWVDDNWANPTVGSDADGAGPLTAIFGYNAFSTIQNGVNVVAPAGTVNVLTGNYPESVSVAKNVSLNGIGTAVVDPPGVGDGFIVTAPATNVTINNFTITDAGNAVNATGVTTLTLRSLTLQGNASGGVLTNVANVNYFTDDGVVSNIDDVNLNSTGFTNQLQHTRAGSSQDPISFTGVTSFAVNTGNANDVINLGPSADTAFSINGGPHDANPPGDTLRIDLDGAIDGPLFIDTLGGVIAGPNFKAISFTQIETLIVLHDGEEIDVDLGDVFFLGSCLVGDQIIVNPSNQAGRIQISYQIIGVSNSLVTYGPATVGPGGKVIVDGCDGDDNIGLSGTLPNQRVQFIGGDGNDFLKGQNGADIFIGGLGDDTIITGNGANVVWGDVEDEIEGTAADGADKITGGTGADAIYAGGGNDTVSAGSGNDVVYGGAGADGLSGNDGNDVIRGGTGNETSLDGGNGNDVLHGGDGDDANIIGGAGNDILIGGMGIDDLKGGTGNDLLIGGDTPIYNDAATLAATQARDTALLAIMMEWNNNTNTFATRINNIKVGGGMNGANTLNPGSDAVDDGSIDKLYGDIGTDWIQRSTADTLTPSSGPDTISFL